VDADDEYIYGYAEHAFVVFELPTVGIHDNDDAPSIPKRSFLLQNYPNPFNAQTTIEFTLERASYVIIDIYDVAGRKVATAADVKFGVGLNRVVFNSKQLSSGPYFYRINTDNTSDSRKMLLLK